MIKHIFITFLFVSGAIFHGNTEIENNSFFIHLDKPFYITGDVIWYKLYYPKGQALQERTVAIKGILINSEGQIVERFFHKTSNADYLTGHINIPYNYKSGPYRLLFNSNITTEDNEITLSEVMVPIYNDLEPFESSLSSSGKKQNEEAIDLSELRLDVTLGKSTFSARDLINATIEIKDLNGNPVNADYSVSVIDKNIIMANPESYTSVAKGEELPIAAISGLPQDIYLKGTIYREDETPMQANVIGAYASKQNRIHYTKSKENGGFTLELPDFYAQQTIQFLPYEKEAKDIKVKLSSDFIPKKEPIEIVYNPQIIQQLTNSQERKKMSQYYESLTTEIDLQEYANEIQELKPNFEFDISKYEKFDRIFDFFSELITPLSFKKNKGVYSASMTNPKSRYAVTSKLSGNPLFIIDGKATRNADFIAKVSMSNIESVEIFYAPNELRKQFNILGLSGVVKINTIIPQFDLPEADKEDVFNVEGLQQIGNFIPFDPNTVDAQLPNFVTTQYWNPHLKTEQSGKGAFSFHQSDDKGAFSIVVVAQDQNGNRGMKVIDYEVK